MFAERYSLVCYPMAYPISKLTRAEEQVMQIFWQQGPSYIKDVRAALPEPLPALTTVSTVVRILEQKGFLGYKPVRRSYRYYASVTQNEYRWFCLGNLLHGYFNGSFGQLISFFAREENLDFAQLEALLRETGALSDRAGKEDSNVPLTTDPHL